MSRSLGSMARFQSVEDVLAKCGIDGGVHRQYPLVFPREALAFYRILLGHEDLVRVLEVEIGGRERMMIREDMRGETQPQPLQMLEESQRIADAGHGMEAPAVEFRRGCGMAGIEQVVEVAAFEGHVETRPDAHTETARPVDHNRIHRSQPRRAF